MDKKVTGISFADHPVKLTPRRDEKVPKVKTDTINIDEIIGVDPHETVSFDLTGVETTSLGRLLNALPIPAFVLDQTVTVLFANKPQDSNPAYRGLAGRSFVQLFHKPAHQAKMRRLVKRVLQRRKSQVIEVKLQSGDEEMWGRMYLRPLKMFDTRFVLVLIEDFTLERKQVMLTQEHEAQLKKAHDQLEKRVHERTRELLKANEQMRQEISVRRRAESALNLAVKMIESTNEAIFVTDATGKVVDVNQAFSEITGYSREEAIGELPTVIRSGQHPESFYSKMRRSLRKTGAWQGEVWDRRKTGEVYPKLLSLNAVKNDDREVTHYVGIFSDITAMKETEGRLKRLAHYDTLSGLPNRVLFNDRLQQALHRADRSRQKVAVLLLDLDRFKNINDTLGHGFGDKLLSAVAGRLTNCLRKGDTAARLGGDEFALVLPGVTDYQGAATIGLKIIDVFAKPFRLGGREIFITTSIGIALYPDDGQAPGQLLQNADTALYHAKEQGKNNFQYYSKEMNLKVLRHLEVEQKLRDALARDRLLLHYQPIVDLESGQVVCAEALLRFSDAQRGVVSPANFIPTAEETGLIVPIGEWVLRTACRQNKEWQEMGLPHIRVSVNVSGRQIKQQGLVTIIMSILEETGLDPKYLDIELTESIMMEDVDATIETFEQIRSNGIRISMDDFGTGYSSLSYLKRFPIDKLKIDQSFVQDIGTGRYEQAIVKTILEVAHSRRLRVIAEGVETPEQLEFVRAHGCDEVQGYLFGHPVPADEFTSLLQEEPKWCRLPVLNSSSAKLAKTSEY